MSKFYPKPYKTFRGGIKFKVDISNYATKADIFHMLTLQVFH